MFCARLPRFNTVLTGLFFHRTKSSRRVSKRPRIGSFFLPSQFNASKHMFCRVILLVSPTTHQIRLRTETLGKIKEENTAVATEIAAERRAKKRLSQHRVSYPCRTTASYVSQGAFFSELYLSTPCRGHSCPPQARPRRDTDSLKG